MDESIEMCRGERRSFFCPNKLWRELKFVTNDCISASIYIRQAIVKKMTREEPERAEYTKKKITLYEMECRADGLTV